MELLWGPDLYGRPAAPRPLAAVAVAPDGRTVRFGTDAPGEALPPGAGEEPPPAIEAERERFAAMGVDARVSAWPSFVVSFEGSFEPPTPSEMEILAVGGATAATLLPARPEGWWEPQEWADLVAGRLGPCAIGLVAGRVTALCHTPVASPSAAEAGVWTHPEARRRGYGAAVTAAWARLAAPRFETLFYSTSLENAGSRGIARTLGLRPLGRIWQLRREG